GFLCPSPRRRRAIRVAVLSIATTVAIGATMGLAVAHWSDGGGQASQQMDRQPPAGGLAHPANSTKHSLSAAGVDASPVTPVPVTLRQEPCNAGAIDPAAFFFNPACGSRRFHARHGARATTRVATFILGRVDAAPEPTGSAPTRLAVAANEPSQTADRSTNPLT